MSTTTLTTTLPAGILQSPLLPPCRVCGDKGSGFHYGVNTCDSCKGFFQRNANRKSWPMCQVPSQCATAKHRKGICATCRYQKCITLGMSKKASRTGRYTHRQKTENTVEVQQLEVQAKLCRAEQSLLTDEERERELDKMIEHITLEHLKVTPSNAFFEFLPERESKYMEEQLLKEKLYGSLNPISDEEYDKIFRETGLDVDGRREFMKTMMPSFAICVMENVNFVKALPGFSALPLEDKVRLIKGTIFECDVFSSYHTVSGDLKVWPDPHNWSIMLGISDIGSIFGKDVIDEYWTLIMHLQKLDLTPEEQALMQSYGAVTTDVELSPEGYRILLAMQEVLFDALYRLICRNHSDQDMFLSRVISTLMELRTVQFHWKQKEVEVLETYKDIEMPPGLREMYY